MIALLAALTAVSILAVPAVLLVRTDRAAWRAARLGVACGLTAGALGVAVGVSG